MAKSSNDAKAETSPESTPDSETGMRLALLVEMKLYLEKMIERRKGLGDYNADSADILALASCQLNIVSLLNKILSIRWEEI